MSKRSNFKSNQWFSARPKNVTVSKGFEMFNISGVFHGLLFYFFTDFSPEISLTCRLTTNL